MKGKHVLLIDDEPGVRSLLRAALESHGYTVDEAGDGREGARRFREGLPELVIVDIFMPEKEGIETLLELRGAHPELKCIVVSGGGMTGAFDYLSHARALGACRAFAKPFRLSELLDAVLELTGGSRRSLSETAPTHRLHRHER